MELQLGKVGARDAVDGLELVVEPEDAGRAELGDVKQLDDGSHLVAGDISVFQCY